jgi:hypothetical protein
VQIWVTGALTLGGLVNANGIPSNVQFFVTGHDDVNVNSGSSMFGSVFAPQAAVNVNAPIFGFIVALKAALNGGAAVHYDLNSPCVPCTVLPATTKGFTFEFTNPAVSPSGDSVLDVTFATDATGNLSFPNDPNYTPLFDWTIWDDVVGGKECGYRVQVTATGANSFADVGIIFPLLVSAAGPLLCTGFPYKGAAALPVSQIAAGFERAVGDTLLDVCEATNGQGTTVEVPTFVLGLAAFPAPLRPPLTHSDQFEVYGTANCPAGACTFTSLPGPALNVTLVCL